MNWDDGCKYEGDWKDDVRHGKGVFEYTNGDKYDGDWADDIQHGRGTYYFHTGDRYEGSYLLGERTGEGVYYHANGDKYVGNFKNGMQDGRVLLPGRMVLCTKEAGKTINVMAEESINGAMAMFMTVIGKTTVPMDRVL